MEAKLNVKLIAHTMNPELVIACAGKLCYSSAGVEQLLEKQTEESIEKFVKMLVGLGHESPLEHASFTFAVEGVSRSLTHQLVRHRLASYSQQSQRYVKEKQFDYIVPKDIKNNEVINKAYTEHMVKTQETYDFITDTLLFDYLYNDDSELIRVAKRVGADFSELELYLYDLLVEIELKNEYALFCQHSIIKSMRIDNKRLILSKVMEKYPKVINTLIKRAIENARYVLPNGAETKIVVTMNLRTLINFCNHRICRRAQEEIQGLALAMKDEVEKVSPLLAKTLGAPCQFKRGCGEGAMACGKPYPKIV